ncbi:uncharacterized protein M421DRAFT_426205 [Didymella exigua CBS 183.55]|uniref:Uncharacterized protein n=1 Tax=Didymella exigua CBS 183.55 TaxID=1150837 RepID=A0A6A5R7E0_9PLEO|nr:uncharacterized protein M421DRAFT_426205 [Didymella exigua CBS 183.55]KAF1923098.1 hypothetical protein M421DRAFT_426205 [Didymella exigua CBS 183.55]
MTQTRASNLESTNPGLLDNLTLNSKSEVPYLGGPRNGAALFPNPTFDVTSKDVASDTATSKEIPCHQEDEKNTSSTASGFLSCNRGGNKVNKAPWLVPHTAEEQKNMWYHASLGMGKKQVADEWGFKSTSVSRSHSPHDAAKPQSTISDEDSGKAGSLQAS